MVSKFDWLGITPDDVQDALDELKDYAIKKDATGAPMGGELEGEDYTLDFTDSKMVAECRSFNVDLM